jgi:hypothetical protein
VTEGRIRASSGQVWETKLIASQLKDSLSSLYLHLYQYSCVHLNISGFNIAMLHMKQLSGTSSVGENKNACFFCCYYLSDVCVIYSMSYLDWLNSCEEQMFHA